MMYLKPERDLKTGKIVRFEEIINDPITQSDGDLIPCLKSFNNPNVDIRLENDEFKFEFDPSNKYK